MCFFFGKKHVLSILLLTLLLLSQAHAENHSKQLWIQWVKYNPLSKKQIDHRLFDAFLKRYLTKPNEGLVLFNYEAVDNKSHANLHSYLKMLSETPISEYNRKEQLAFWINLYNALVIDLVLKHYPLDEIQSINISPGLFSVGPWEANLILVENTPISLHDIRNRIIRPIWNDKRTLYAINNGSIGAPNLSDTVYTSDTLDDALNTATKNYINCMRGVQVIGDKLIVSTLYQWYEEDFGQNKQDVITHLKRYAAPELKKALDHIHTIDSYIYNWHLNGVTSE